MALVVVLGGAGFVGQHLKHHLDPRFDHMYVDVLQSPLTNLTANINSLAFEQFIRDLSEPIVVINLAAARTDFGLSYDQYINANVTEHQAMLRALMQADVRRFIHISSVAALEGEKLQPDERMGCDDSYRATKYMQEHFIKEWCQLRQVPFVSLLPSAIFSSVARHDTNIGTLQKLGKLLPIVPVIDVPKSLTYVEHLCAFIVRCIGSEIPPGRYLTIERPTLKVTEIVSALQNDTKPTVSVPFFRTFLRGIAAMVKPIGSILNIDLRLNQDRITKLYLSTDFNPSGELDGDHYQKVVTRNLPELLSGLERHS